MWSAGLNRGTLTEGAELRCHECEDSSLLEGNGSMSLGDQRVFGTLQSRIFVVQNTKLPNGKREGPETRQHALIATLFMVDGDLAVSTGD